jgi:hypothetical protein
VNYADFLAWTLPWNKQHFDKMVIVTSKDDGATQAICGYHNVPCITTDVFFENDRAFAKAAGINEGLKALKLDSWVVHMDCDIVLPPRTRKILSRINLQANGVYGIDRMNCYGFCDWVDFVMDPEIQHPRQLYTVANRFVLGPRLTKIEFAPVPYDGYAPIGFFQMWHPQGSKVYTYPDHDPADNGRRLGAANRSDTIFGELWPRQHRHLIPEIVAVHLESEFPNVKGLNWRGRRTPLFTVEIEEAMKRAAQKRKYSRHKHHHPHPPT